MPAAALTSCSTVEIEKGRFVLFYLLVKSFLHLLGTHMLFPILWGNIVLIHYDFNMMLRAPLRRSSFNNNNNNLRRHIL
jgi:hypothetical protein